MRSRARRVPLALEGPLPRELPELRRWFRREMVRIQTESVCRSHAIFDTLARTSELADAVIERAYEIAVAETRQRTHPPQNAAYVPPQPDVGDRAGAAGHAGIRSGVRRRSGLRAGRFRRCRAAILDARRWASCGHSRRLYRRRRSAHGGHAPAAQRRRRSAGANRERRKGLLRAQRGGLGGDHLYEVARRGRRSRARGSVSASAPGGGLAAVRTKRAVPHGAAPDARAAGAGTGAFASA